MLLVMRAGHATGRSEIHACNHKSKDHFGITSYRPPGGSCRQRHMQLCGWKELGKHALSFTAVRLIDSNL